MTDQELLEAAATALYGEGWIAPLARQLDVALKTVTRWRSGYSRIPPGVWQDLHTLLIERADMVQDITPRLRSRIEAADQK